MVVSMVVSLGSVGAEKLAAQTAMPMDLLMVVSKDNALVVDWVEIEAVCLVALREETKVEGTDLSSVA